MLIEFELQYDFVFKFKLLVLEQHSRQPCESTLFSIVDIYLYIIVLLVTFCILCVLFKLVLVGMLIFLLSDRLTQTVNFIESEGVIEYITIITHNLLLYGFLKRIFFKH